ncbi:uncharacterized protein LOC110893192 [Helianthus annuus]|uniref:uncharacterized protein LOC110893192 n=1 Tax=Helianthus annuus TaxID=4232 RepID=UPI000B8F8F91|nr:uncharacterized protein LOC110893192 [Helianthus annuus]
MSIGSNQVNTLWQWKRDPMQGTEPEELSQLLSLLDSVSLSDRSDRWIWIGEGKEDFSVAAVKRTIMKGRGSSSGSKFKWCKWVPAKCNIFAWRAVINRIPTVEALRRRNISIQNSSCGLCKDGEDEVNHLFSGCYVANVVWSYVSNWCRVPHIYAFSIQDLVEYYVRCGLKEPEKTIFQGVMIIACWSLWKARNEARFRNVSVRIEKVISEVKVLGFLWVKNRTKFRSLSWENWCKFVIM